MQKYSCSVCGFVFDEAAGIPSKGIVSGTRWEDVPNDFSCPLCGAPKSVFKLIEETKAKPATDTGLSKSQTDNHAENHVESLKELSPGEISAICSSLAKGCEKQRLMGEMEAFNKLADYFKSKATVKNAGMLNAGMLSDAAKMLDADLSTGIPDANAAANADTDRGAKRSLVWCEKVSIILSTMLERFAKEGEVMLKDTRIWVCDICGFISLGDTPPEICPVCKVPKFKIIEVERG